MADLQYFGNMQTAQGMMTLMLSIDEDAPQTGHLVSFGNQNSPRVGAEVDIQRSFQDWRITVRHIYRQDSGKVYRAQLDSLEQARVMGAWATLSSMLGADPASSRFLSGHWYDPVDRAMRTITLYPASRVESVQAFPCQNWEDFKSWAQRVHDAGAVAFRGQASNQWRLETSLHRVGRANLSRYCSETLQEFHSHLEATGLHIDLDKPTEFARMVALAQHYGLPTPLLDWTQSPYIAAWFAFSDALGEQSSKPVSSNDSQNAFVRIYALTPAFEKAFNFEVMPQLDSLVPFAAFAKVTPRDNPRLYAQQGRFLVTNMGNLESYLVHLDKIGQGEMLWAADVPKVETVKAMKDLNLMGLSAATMFPGLEGACRMMRHQMSVQTLSAQRPLPMLPIFGPTPPVPPLPPAF